MPGSGASDGENYVAASTVLRISGDLANGSKHLTIRKPRLDPTTAVGAQSFGLELGEAGPGAGSVSPRLFVHYTVSSQGTVYDAFRLATDCIAEWDHYLKGKGLHRVQARLVPG